MRRLPVVLHVVYKNDWSSAFLPGCACVHLPTMTPRVKPPHTLVSVLHWLWYCRATALYALANLTLLLGKNTLPFPAFGNLNFVSPPHRRACTSIPKLRPNIRFPHQQDFFPIRSVTKSSTARFSHENLVEKFKIFVQDFVPIRTALTIQSFSTRWAFLFLFVIEKNPVCRDRTHVPTCQKVPRLPLSYRGNRLVALAIAVSQSPCAFLCFECAHPPRKETTQLIYLAASRFS